MAEPIVEGRTYGCWIAQSSQKRTSGRGGPLWWARCTCGARALLDETTLRAKYCPTCQHPIGRNILPPTPPEHVARHSNGAARPTLQDRIAAILNDDAHPSAAELNDLLDEIDAAITAAETGAAAARERALDPSNTDAASDRAKMGDLQFEQDRLQVALTKLEAVWQRRLEHEEFDKWLREKYQPIRAESDRLAGLLESRYQAFVAEIVPLLTENRATREMGRYRQSIKATRTSQHTISGAAALNRAGSAQPRRLRHRRLFDPATSSAARFCDAISLSLASFHLETVG
jgi:hypothetical protein